MTSNNGYKLFIHGAMLGVNSNTTKTHLLSLVIQLQVMILQGLLNVANYNTSVYTA